MIRVGDEVVCVQPAGVDDNCEPQIRPVVGEVYTVTSVYRAFYGLGCQLEGLNPRPYKGYLLKVVDNLKLADASLGWYFQKLAKVDLNNLQVVSVGQDEDWNVVA